MFFSVDASKIIGMKTKHKQKQKQKQKTNKQTTAKTKRNKYKNKTKTSLRGFFTSYTKISLFWALSQNYQHLKKKKK